MLKLCALTALMYYVAIHTTHVYMYHIKGWFCCISSNVFSKCSEAFVEP